MLLALADDDGDDGDEDNDGDVLLAPASQLLLVQLDCCSCRWNWKCPHLESLPWTGKSQTNIQRLKNDYTSKLFINYFPEVLALDKKIKIGRNFNQTSTKIMMAHKLQYISSQCNAKTHSEET